MSRCANGGVRVNVEQYLASREDKTAPHYLHHRKAVRCKSRKDFERANTYKHFKVRKTYLKGFEISTVFLFINHAWGEGLPLHFETMVFTKEDHKLSDYQIRSHDHRAALKTHQAVIQMVKRYIKEEK